jgi:hypothetical protein
MRREAAPRLALAAQEVGSRGRPCRVRWTSRDGAGAGEARPAVESYSECEEAPRLHDSSSFSSKLSQRPLRTRLARLLSSARVCWPRGSGHAVVRDSGGGLAAIWDAPEVRELRWPSPMQTLAGFDTGSGQPGKALRSRLGSGGGVGMLMVVAQGSDRSSSLLLKVRGGCDMDTPRKLDPCRIPGFPVDWVVVSTPPVLEVHQRPSKMGRAGRVGA